MKKYWLYVVALLLPIFTLAQSLPAYTLTGENTVCGGNIKVDWSAAVAASVPVTQWKAELYDSNGARQAQQDFDSAGKAEFTNYPSDTYKIKVVRKDGNQTHPLQLTQTVTSTYQRFSVDMSKTTQVKATGPCSSDGSISFKIKNGAGPFVVKLYGTLTETTPRFSSVPTNKSGSETTVTISGVPPSVQYYVEVTDQVGGGSCSLTEPRNVRRVVTDGAAGHFIKNYDYTTWRPKKSTDLARVATGFFTIEIDNAAAGPGPFNVTVKDFDTAEVLVSGTPITKGAGATTTAYIVPDASKKFLPGKRYLLTVTDGACSWGKQVANAFGYSTKGLRMFLVPSSSCTNCNLFDLAVAADYTHLGRRPTYYPFLLTVRIQRIGNPDAVYEFTNEEALPMREDGKYHVYGDAGDEFGYWNWWDPMIYKIRNYQLKPGDKITVTYTDSNNVNQQIQHTVAPPNDKPTTDLAIGAKSSGGPCDKTVLLKTYLQSYSNGAYYNTFCNTAGLQTRVKVNGSWVAAPSAGVTLKGKLFRYFNEVNNNEHIAIIQNSAANTYQIEYAGATGILNGSSTKDCKHYLSNTFTQSQVAAINPLNNIQVNVGGTPAQTLEEAVKGNKVYLGNSDPDSGQLDFFKGNNKLTIKLERIDGKKSVKFNATGPWNLKGEYEVKFPYTIQLPEDGNPQYIYQFIDIPVGQYKVTLSDQCPGRPAVTQTITVDQVSSPSYTLNTIETTDCASGGGDSKGSIVFNGSTTKNVTAGIGSTMIVYKDLDNGQDGRKFHLREGAPVASTTIVRTDNLLDTNKYDYQGRITNLPPGHYLLALTTGAGLYSIVEKTKARANGYMYPDLPTPSGTKIYKAFTIKKITDITPITAIGMCDPANPSSGVVRVEMPAGSEPEYPITYTLYKVSGGNKTVVEQGGNPVKKTVAAPPVAPASFSDAFATFNNIPKLTGGDTYEVKFESGCLDRWVPVPDFGSLSSPNVHVNVAQACFGAPLTLSVDLPDTMYDIQWKSDPANALDGVSAADLKKSSITFNPTMEAEYWATYKMKTGFGCTPSEKNTPRKEVKLKVINFTDAAIGTLPDLTTTLPLNKCTGTVTWTAPAITDTEGCGYRLTWRVVKADGTELYVPTPDADGNTPALTWDGFPVGESYVEYTVKGKADGGTEGKKRFKVTVTASNIDVAVTGKFVGAIGSDTQITTIAKGHTIYYKATIENKTTQALGGGVLKVTLPDNTNGNYELPAATDSGIIKSELGSGITVSYESPRVLQFEGIDGMLFSQGTKVSVYIPIKIKNNADCTAYENACAAILTGKPAFVFTLKNCSAAGEMTKEGEGAYAQIKNDGDCTRVELFCGSNLNLTARGTGYTSYKWYSSSDDGASYSEISAATTATQAVTAAGYYKVDKI
ncbi:hypothetical protein HMPREF9331_01422, partial [Capnocytophaga granulosa ATCC 51502]